MAERRQPPSLDWFGYSVGIVILAAFVGSQIASLSSGSQVPAGIYTLMGIVAGGTWGATMLKRK